MLLFIFGFFINIFSKQHVGLIRREQEQVEDTHFCLYILVGRIGHYVLVLIWALMGNTQQLNQLLALCVIF